MSQNTVKVWDVFIRVFHWSLVILFAIAYFTGEDESNLHIYSGYIILGLVISRIIWGFVGSKYAKFNNFIYSPNKVLNYIKHMNSPMPKRYLGHNPAGGYMVVALLTLLLLVTFSGLKVYGLEGGGPLAASSSFSLISTATADDDEHEYHHDSDEDREEELWEEIHEASSNFMVLLIVLHILGVIVSSRLHGENLVRAMITGRKKEDG